MIVQNDDDSTAALMKFLSYSLDCREAHMKKNSLSVVGWVCGRVKGQRLKVKNTLTLTLSWRCDPPAGHAIFLEETV